MAAPLITVLFFCLISAAEDPKKKHSLKQITPQPGDDVTLPCKAPNNINIVTVEWTRFDPERLVYLKEDRHLVTTDQDPSYVNRVQLKDDEMKNGELSLILKNVNNNDEGRYECRYVEKTATQMKLISIIYLDVRDPQEENVTAHPGDNVTLPCEAPNNIIIAAVEWTRSDPDRSVYLKRDGHLNTADQDPSYVNRVQLKDDEMKNGELSLILKNVTNNDEGTYECRYVQERGGRRKRSDERKLSSTVILKVEGPTVGNSRDGKHSESGKDKHQHLGVILTVSLIAALVVAVGLVGLVGFMIYKKHKGRSEKKPILPVDDPDVLQQLQEH